MTKSFNHLLRETLKAPAQEPTSECLDAGVLAAWFEGTLDPGERAAAEAHASECSRCQAALAAMIRIEPPIESRPWWRSPAFGWLVPITVAAAAVVIFIRPSWHRMANDSAVPLAPAPIVNSAEQSAQRQAPEAAAVDSVAPAAAPPLSAAQARPAESARQETRGRRHDQAKAEAPPSPTVPSLSVDAAPLKDRVGVPVDESTLQRAASAAADSAAPPRVSELGSVVAVTTPPAAAAPAPPAEDRSSGARAIAEKAFAETVTVNRTVSATQQPAIVIRAPSGSTRWRVTTPGSVQRSTDAGRTWETQTTGVRAVITNGSAPSDSVCWLVGKGGVILQSADRRTWRQVPFPQAVDLTSVAALDANTAAVVTVDGRTFRTTDGGKNWK